MTGWLVGIAGISLLVATVAIMVARSKAKEVREFRELEKVRADKLKAVLEHRTTDGDAARKGRAILVEITEAKNEEDARRVYTRAVDLYNKL